MRVALCIDESSCAALYLFAVRKIDEQCFYDAVPFRYDSKSINTDHQIMITGKPNAFETVYTKGNLGLLLDLLHEASFSLPELYNVSAQIMGPWTSSRFALPRSASTIVNEKSRAVPGPRLVMTLPSFTTLSSSLP